jgi:two-component sensor kinase czcS
LIDYKKLGVKAFYKGRFDEARNFFSLAYGVKADKKLLFLIMLCSLAKTRQEEAMMLFDVFKVKDKVGIKPEEMDEILSALESKIDDCSEEIEEQNAISYDDFMDLVEQKGDFRKVFENIMFSTRVLIDNRDDFLDFVRNLIKNDFIEMGLTYLENAATMFKGDERLNSLMREIGRKNENLY